MSTHQSIGIEIKIPPAPIHVFSVYLPSRSGCTDAFREALDLLNATMDTLPSISYTIILGDLNADPGSPGGPLSTTRVNEQGRILSQYLSLWNFVSAYLHKSNLSSSHTLESEAHSTVSTIDHILCHQSFLPRFQSASNLPEHSLNTSASSCFNPALLLTASTLRTRSPPQAWIHSQKLVPYLQTRHTLSLHATSPSTPAQHSPIPPSRVCTISPTYPYR